MDHSSSFLLCCCLSWSSAKLTSYLKFFRSRICPALMAIMLRCWSCKPLKTWDQRNIFIPSGQRGTGWKRTLDVAEQQLPRKRKRPARYEDVESPAYFRRVFKGWIPPTLPWRDRHRGFRYSSAVLPKRLWTVLPHWTGIVQGMLWRRLQGFCRGGLHILWPKFQQGMFAGTARNYASVESGRHSAHYQQLRKPSWMKVFGFSSSCGCCHLRIQL